MGREENNELLLFNPCSLTCDEMKQLTAYASSGGIRSNRATDAAGEERQLEQIIQKAFVSTTCVEGLLLSKGGGSEYNPNNYYTKKIETMSFLSEVCCILFLSFGVPLGVYTIPPLIYCIGKYIIGDILLTLKIFVTFFMVPSAILPQPFIPELLNTWLSNQLLKYFSFRVIIEQEHDEDQHQQWHELLEEEEEFEQEEKKEETEDNNTHQQYHQQQQQQQQQRGQCTRSQTKTPAPLIVVAPPHGAFPYGNMMYMLSCPSLCSYNYFKRDKQNDTNGNNKNDKKKPIKNVCSFFHCRGLASSSALRMPLFKNISRAMGAIDADKKTAYKHLIPKKEKLQSEGNHNNSNNENSTKGDDNERRCVGVSPGGVAEIFETNTECIIIKNRMGIIKLAIETGSDILPVYFFGNTKCLSCYTADHNPTLHSMLKTFSRKAGFAPVPVYGRYYLPIPYRIPILAVIGKPISTKEYYDKYVVAASNNNTIGNSTGAANKKIHIDQEVLEHVQSLLISSIENLFDKYKVLYGWEDKKLIIK